MTTEDSVPNIDEGATAPVDVIKDEHGRVVAIDQDGAVAPVVAPEHLHGVTHDRAAGVFLPVEPGCEGCKARAAELDAGGPVFLADEKAERPIEDFAPPTTPTPPGTRGRRGGYPWGYNGSHAEPPAGPDAGEVESVAIGGSQDVTA